MKGRNTSLQVLLLAAILELCTCVVDPKWSRVYRAMTSDHTMDINLLSSCPWDKNTKRLLYANQLCLNLTILRPDGPVFASHGRCQAIYSFSCNSRSIVVGHTCIRDHTIQIAAMGKRNGDVGDTYRCPPVSRPEINVTDTEYSGAEIKPIVGKFEQTEPTNLPHVPKDGVGRIYTAPMEHIEEKRPLNTYHISSFGRLFPSYLLNTNAQFRPQFQARQPPPMRQFAGLIGGHLSRTSVIG